MDSEQVGKPQRSPSVRLLALLFIGSGFSALAYQVILSRYAQLIVGATAYAISALLVAFMLGMSLGAALGGRIADRTRHPLRLYALAEGAIGLYCASFPLLFPYLTDLYLVLVPEIGEGSAIARNGVRFVLGTAAFLLPTFFMGITTPAFARAVASTREDSGAWLARLYGWNTLGAALGALSTAYLLVPKLGLVGSMFLATTLNFAVAFLAFRWSEPVAPFEKREEASESSLDLRTSGGLGVSEVLLLVAFASGFLSFALEILWTHLLAILLGNSVYAFGLMLGSLLLGLSLGTLFARKLARDASRARHWIGASLLVAGLSVLGTLELWDEIPSVFLLLADRAPSFALMEGVRFAIAFTLILLPTAAFGITFPLTLHCASSRRAEFGARVGRVYAVNTIGAVLGALCGAYWILPRLGSLRSLEVLGSLLLACGGLALLALSRHPRRRLLAIAAMSSVLWAPLLPLSWDFNALNMAAAVYLGDSASARGEILFQREDATGGLTTVVEERGVRTLLTNGKFQGDDAEEIPIQHRAANIPALFTPERERALVVGLGTGVTLASLAAHGFEEIVCAELSRPVIEAARRHFSEVNGGILDAPHLKLVEEDGRSVLFESPERYDVITVEVSSIWFAGVGSIYSREFYRLAAARLRRSGVLLQWFPIHHLSARNLFLVVNTVRSEFPYVSLWTHRHQSFVVASNEPLLLDLDSIRSDQAREEMRPYLRELASGSPLELLSDLVVTDSEIDRFLDSMALLLRTRRSVVSTDTWPVIEYETPKDVLENFSYFQNRAIFRRFRSTALFAFRGEPKSAERVLALAAFSRGWSDPRALSRLARAWREIPESSDAMGQWLYDELTGQDAFGSKLSSDPVGELGAELEPLAAMIRSAESESSCEPIPRFVSRLHSIPFQVGDHSGRSLDGTSPENAVDGIFDPALQKGWRVRPDGRPVFLELELPEPARIETIHLVVRAIDGTMARSRIFGQDEHGTWRPIADGGRPEEIGCEGARGLQLGDRLPRLRRIRVEVQGEGSSFRVALHEVWAMARGGSTS